jgi:hypothetical protein
MLTIHDTQSLAGSRIDHDLAIAISLVVCTIAHTRSGETGVWCVRLKISLAEGQTKSASRRALSVLRYGDPQTYALLHGSVFKERIPTPDRTWSGSLTTPKWLGVRVTTAIIPPLV